MLLTSLGRVVVVSNVGAMDVGGISTESSLNPGGGSSGTMLVVALLRSLGGVVDMGVVALLTSLGLGGVVDGRYSESSPIEEMVVAFDPYNEPG